MARTSQWVEAGKRKLELSNLKKVLYPDDGIVKAEIIEYYLKIAPTILSHIKGRPLTLVRFPDGITGEQFYQKNRPDWAPQWIEYEKLGSDTKKDYMIATEEASLVWLANLACLELHQMHSRKPHYDKPDYMVFDLDPPEGYDFRKLVTLAFDLKEHIEGYGYHTFPKTTGGKGIHIVCPVYPKWDFHTVFEAAQEIAKPFTQANKKKATLHIRKESRKGRVLIDVYRIRQGQSIISPYSMRGVSGAPVSMPLYWEQLQELSDPKEWNIKTVVEQVLSEGDAWEGINAYAVDLHTKSSDRDIKEMGPNPKYKTPETLESYTKKRDFKRTPEPEAEYQGGDGTGFVVHRHHASRLHYDLRLEEDGTLKSWAVPRGMPPRPGIKRLAVATEDHPMKYLNWEGTIPKGQYGGGDMWIFALGKYEKIKEKKKGFYFNLYSKELSGEYRMHIMKDKEWLLERVDNPQINWVQDEVEFMLSHSRNDVPGGDYVYEVKWDGIRVMISIDEGEIRIRSRNQRDITKQFPELLIPEQAFRATAGLFDAEIVVLDEEGKPNFKKVINRLMQYTDGGIKKGAAKNPVFCYVFDCLYLDGRTIVNEPLMRRREWLKDVIRKDTPYRFSQIVEEGKELFEAAKKLGLEGIMAKDPNSKYLPGKRSPNWYKIKVRQTVDCVILGYTRGKGDREKYFGALQVSEVKDGEQIYRGKVGTGYDQKTMKSIYDQLSQLKEIDCPVGKPIDKTNTVWVEPVLYCEVQYAQITNNNTFREPVFLRMRPDLVSS